MKGRNKKLQSNEIRIQSLHKKLEAEETTKKIIKQALSNLDKKANKHITFDSDDENDEVGLNLEEKTNSKKQAALSANILGFDESDDEGIQIKPQFEGKSGEKLLRIQSKVGMDERFKMDERFAESDSEPEDEEEVPMPMNETDERNQNLMILQSVVGSAAYAKTLKRKSKTFNDPDARRYNPTKAGHDLLEVKPSSENTTAKKKRKKKKEEESVKTDSSRYFEISSNSLKDAFGKQQPKKEKEEEVGSDAEEKEEAFSFLKMMGHDPDENIEDEDEAMDVDVQQATEEPTMRSKLEKKFSRKVFKHDSSDSEMDDDGFDERDAKGWDEPAPTVAKSRTFFMATGDDARIMEGARLFFSHQSEDEKRSEWEQCKDQLQQDYKKKHRNAAKMLSRVKHGKTATTDQ